MPPKRKSDGADPNGSRTKFQKRGHLDVYRRKTKSDCVLTVDKKRIELHQVLLISRSGRFKELLTENGREDRDGRVLLTLKTHALKSVQLVVEFIYGDGSVEILEYPSKDQPIIQDCILLYNLGHDFDIPDMIKYARNHLGVYLSRKLKDICIYPFSEAKKAVAPRAFLDDLETGITTAYKSEHKEDDRDHPQKMLVDFAVAGREVLFRDPSFMFSLDQDVLPTEFLKDFIKQQFGKGCHTIWMTELKVRSGKLMKELEETRTKQHKKCEGCRAATGDEVVTFNPWSRPHVGQIYTQVCCEECARGMDKGNGEGVSWEVFGDTE